MVFAGQYCLYFFKRKYFNFFFVGVRDKNSLKVNLAAPSPERKGMVLGCVGKKSFSLSLSPPTVWLWLWAIAPSPPPSPVVVQENKKHGAVHTQTQRSQFRVIFLAPEQKKVFSGNELPLPQRN